MAEREQIRIARALENINKNLSSIVDLLARTNPNVRLPEKDESQVVFHGWEKEE